MGKRGQEESGTAGESLLQQICVANGSRMWWRTQGGTVSNQLQMGGPWVCSAFPRCQNPQQRLRHSTCMEADPKLSFRYCGKEHTFKDAQRTKGIWAPRKRGSRPDVLDPLTRQGVPSGHMAHSGEEHSLWVEQLSPDTLESRKPAFGQHQSKWCSMTSGTISPC